MAISWNALVWNVAKTHFGSLIDQPTGQDQAYIAPHPVILFGLRKHRITLACVVLVELAPVRSYDYKFGTHSSGVEGTNRL